MSDEEDPFEAFEETEDREGDPFERLGDVQPAEEDGEADPVGEAERDIESPSKPTDGTEAEAADDEPVFEETFIEENDPIATDPEATPGESSAGGPTGGSDDPVGADDPFAGMEGRDGDPFGGGESVFESVDIEGIDPDEVWASLDEEPTQPSVEGSRYVEVSKHRFCEQCEFFASPPNAHCTNEEAEIIEYLDMETVRLLDCPVVAEQRQLENEE